MKKSRKTRSLRAVFCALAFSAATTLPLTSCGTANPDWTAHDNYKVYMIGQAENVQFWEYVEQGAKECARDLEFEVVYHNAQNSSDIEGQKTLINDAILNGADAIVISPNSESGLNELLRDATEKNIPILTINSDVSYDKRVCYIGTDNRNSGALAARHAAEILLKMQEQNGADFPGRIGIIGHSDVATAAIDRIDGFANQITASMKPTIMASLGRMMAMQAAQAAQQRAAEQATQAALGQEGDEETGEAAQQGGAPDGAGEGEQGAQGGEGGQGAQGGEGSGALEALYQEKYAPVADILYCNGNADTAKDQAKSMLAEHPDIKLLFATNERSTVGVCEAIEELGLSNKIAVIGFNSNDSEINYIKTGTLTGTVLQNPYNIGYLGAHYAYKLLHGDSSISQKVDTGTIYANIDNLDSTQVQLILDPAGYVAAH